MSMESVGDFQQKDIAPIGLEDSNVKTSIPFIEINHLDVVYPGGVTALHDLSLNIAEGEFVVILGPSGCGKSTLLQVLAGLQKPTTGLVRVGPLTNPPPGLDRGFVFQQAGLLPWFDVFTNIEIGLRSKGLSKVDARLTSLRFVQKMGLEGFGEKYPHQLSGGMQQRVGVARAFAIDPPTLLMDEPFAALDAQTRLVLQEELITLWEGTKKTIIFVTHSIEEAVFLADRIVVMGRSPGTVKTNIDVELPRPRNEGTRGTQEFQRLFDHLWGMLRHDAKMAISEAD